MITEITNGHLPPQMEQIATGLSIDPQLRFEWFPKSHWNVNNCADASKARNIFLSQEMKSLLFKLRNGFFLFHLKGDECVDPRKINKLHREHFGRKTKIRFARPAEFTHFHLLKGTVNPFLNQFWNMVHFFSPSLFEEEWLYTNDGTLNGYIKFSPELLKVLPKKIEAEFIKD